MRLTGLVRGSIARLAATLLVCSAVTIGSAHFAPARASAQCMGSACTSVHPDGKGMIGLGLLGAEIGLIIPAIVQNAAHTNEWWPYLVFPLIGIGAGIGGGFALEQATPTQPEIDIAFMVGSFVLLIPAIIGTLALSTYTPSPDSDEGDEDMSVEPSPEGDTVQAVQTDSSTSASPSSSSGSGGSGSTAPSSGSSSGSSGSSSGGTSRRDVTSPASLAGGPGLIRLDGTTSSVGVGVPIVASLPRYSAEELTSLRALQQQYDVQVPIVSGTF